MRQEVKPQDLVKPKFVTNKWRLNLHTNGGMTEKAKTDYDQTQKEANERAI